MVTITKPVITEYTFLMFLIAMWFLQTWPLMESSEKQRGKLVFALGVYFLKNSVWAIIKNRKYGIEESLSPTVGQGYW